MKSRVTSLGRILGIGGEVGLLVSVAVSAYLGVLVGVLLGGFSVMSIIGGAVLDGLAEISIKLGARNVIDLDS